MHLLLPVAINNMYLIIFSITIIIISYFIFFLNRRIRNFDDFPTVPSGFFLGNIRDFSSTTSIIKTCSRLLSTYGSTVKLKVGPCFTFLLSSDYKLIQFILGKNRGLRKSENYLFLEPWLGSGLLTSEGSEWKRSRKILTPAFHFEILRDFVEVFESVGSVLVEKIERSSDSKSVDLFPFITQCTLDIICESVMGTKVNAQKGENSEYVNSVETMTRTIIDRSLSVMKITNWTYFFTSDYYLQRKLIKVLHKFTLKVITARKETTEKLNPEENHQKLAFLDLLLNYRDHEGQQLTDQKIRSEVDTFTFAGHDTTASAICFTMYCLANNGDIQNKVLNEQKNLFGEDKNPQISYQHLQNMKYLENVIKESLRLYPPVPLIGRFTTEDLQFDNHFVNKGTNLVLFLYGLHRNPENFPDPEKFDPDRFKNFDGSLSFAYLPFSAGQRNCIGQKFAMLEMKSVISKIVRHFELRPAEPQHELVLSMEIVLKSASGVKIGLKKRF